MAADNFDTRYWQTETQETTAVEQESGKAVMGLVCLNREEFLLVVEMAEAVSSAGCDRIEFIEIDEDTGEERITSPGLNDLQLQMLDLINETYQPLIQAARQKGRPHVKRN